MVFGKASEDCKMDEPPARAARSVRGDRPVHRGAAAKARVRVAPRLKNSAQAKRIVCEGPRRTVIDGPFAESRGAACRLFNLGGQGHGRGRGLGEAQPQSRAGQERDGNPAVLRGGDLAEFVTPESSRRPVKETREARRRLKCGVTAGDPHQAETHQAIEATFRIEPGQAHRGPGPRRPGMSIEPGAGAGRAGRRPVRVAEDRRS